MDVLIFMGSLLGALILALVLSATFIAGICAILFPTDNPKPKYRAWLLVAIPGSLIVYSLKLLGLDLELVFIEAFQISLAMVVAYFGYSAGTHFFNNEKKDVQTLLFQGFLGCAVIALASAEGLGTHREDADPLRGGGEVVVDYEPSDTERQEAGSRLFVLTFVPFVLGVRSAHKKQRDLESTSGQTGKQDSDETTLF